MARCLPMKVNAVLGDMSASLAAGDEPLCIDLNGSWVGSSAKQALPQRCVAGHGQNTEVSSGVSTATSAGSDVGSDVETTPAGLAGLKVPQTTLMIRNVPVLYSKDALLAEWANNGSYDFFYLPWNSEKGRNMSYAFLNFTSEQAALLFVQRWQKQRLPRYNSRKPLNISFADVQGLTENLGVLIKRRVNLEQCKAAVFKGGQQACLEEAVRAAMEPPSSKRQSGKKSVRPARAVCAQRGTASQVIKEGQIFAL